MERMHLLLVFPSRWRAKAEVLCWQISAVSLPVYSVLDFFVIAILFCVVEASANVTTFGGIWCCQEPRVDDANDINAYVISCPSGRMYRNMLSIMAELQLSDIALSAGLGRKKADLFYHQTPKRETTHERSGTTTLKLYRPFFRSVTCI